MIPAIFRRGAFRFWLATCLSFLSLCLPPAVIAADGIVQAQSKPLRVFILRGAVQHGGARENRDLRLHRR